VNALFRGTDLAKMVSYKMHAFYSIGQKMMVWIVFERFKNLRNVKDTKNFCFWHECTILGTEVGKMFSHQMHPSYCFGPKMTFASVLEHSSTFLM
jgi:hypothetical protein